MFQIKRVAMGADGELANLAPPIAVCFCDEDGCGSMATVPFPFPNAREGHGAALQALAKGGWLLDLDKHRCPPHARLLMQAQPLVTLDGGLNGFVRGRG